jgi:serine/threonine protein kinase/Tol biopolymer transport system component
MTPALWRQLEQLYHSAREREPGSRSAFLAEACGTNEELRQRVELLLGQDDSGDKILDRPAAELFVSSEELRPVPPVPSGSYLAKGEDYAPSLMHLAPGTQLGPYRIEGTLGAGGMGEVFRATDTRLGRAVAVKIANVQFIARFEHEAKAISALNHPHICTLYDVGPNYLVMELVEGDTLAEKLKNGALSMDLVVRYGSQIADALAQAHAKGIVHGDLKPGNIMIAKAGVKVLDFGLATSAHREAEALTAMGAVMGTPAYMAPEQMEGKPTSARSDIFALGLVLYEMAAGKRPTSDRKPLESAALESIIGTCLEKDPEDRWQSARDVRITLALPAGQAVAAKQPARILRGITAAAVVLSTLAVAATWALFHSERPPAETQAWRFQSALPPNGTLANGASSSPVLALSPNGRMLAFVLEVKGKSGVWIQELDGISARLLAGTEGAVLVLWSPDSKSVAFRVENKLFRSDLTSGAPVLVSEIPESPNFGADWGTDGILFAASGAIKQVPASGGTPVDLLAADPNSGGFLSFPRALPGGRLLYSTAVPPSVFGAPLDHPDQRIRILPQNVAPVYAAGQNGKDYLLWIRNNTLVAQEFDPGGLRVTGEATAIANPAQNVTASSRLLLYDASLPMSQLAWVDRNGNVLQTVGDPGSILFTGLSPDGERVAVTLYPQSADATNSYLWLIETRRGLSSRFTTSSGVHLSPVWSPDGQTIVFGSRGGLVSKPSNGVGEERKVLPNDRLLNPTDWSRDMRFILYNRIVTDDLDVWMLPVDSDGKRAGDPKPYLDGPSDQAGAKFSPDGGWVAWQSNDSGRSEIYVDTFPKLSGRKQVSTNGGSGPRWNPTGGELFYRSPDGNLMAAAIRLGKPGNDRSAALVSPPRTMFAMPVNAPAFGDAAYDVAPDGRRFLIQVPAKQPAPRLNVIVNWTSLLKNGKVVK